MLLEEAEANNRVFANGENVLCSPGSETLRMQGSYTVRLERSQPALRKQGRRPKLDDEGSGMAGKSD